MNVLLCLQRKNLWRFCLKKVKIIIVFDKHICYNMDKYGKAVKRDDYYERNDKRNAQSVR